MVKLFITYIPCYIGNEDKFYEYMQKTIDSIKQYSYFKKFKLFICQKDKEKQLEKRCIKNNLKNFDIVYLEGEPMFLPIRVFEYMQKDKETKESDYIFYLEGDHILHVEDIFISKIFNELDKGNIVMPHRLGKTKFDNMEYMVFNGLYVGNYQIPGVKPYNENFERMVKYNILNNKNHNDYAGCYFTKKSSIMGIHQKCKYNRRIGYFHFYGLLKHFGLPYTMKLEFPSLILALWGEVILKSKNIGDCYVEHLSQNGYV